MQVFNITVTKPFSLIIITISDDSGPSYSGHQSLFGVDWRLEIFVFQVVQGQEDQVSLDFLDFFPGFEFVRFR